MYLSNARSFKEKQIVSSKARNLRGTLSFFNCQIVLSANNVPNVANCVPNNKKCFVLLLPAPVDGLLGETRYLCHNVLGTNISQTQFWNELTIETNINDLTFVNLPPFKLFFC